MLESHHHHHHEDKEDDDDDDECRVNCIVLVLYCINLTSDYNDGFKLWFHGTIISETHYNMMNKYEVQE